MRDKVSEFRVKLLHPKIRDEVKFLIEKAESGFPSKIAIRVVQGFRTFAEQDELFAQGRTKPGKKVTNAKGGRSYHNYGLAFDFALMYDRNGNGSWETISWDVSEDFDKDLIPDWREVVKVFEDANYIWGGTWSKFTDAPHLQKTFGHNWQDLLVKYNEGDFIEKYVRV